MLGGQPLHDRHLTYEEASRIVVVVDSTLAAREPGTVTASTRVGHNRDVPMPGSDTTVAARREDDGSLVVQVGRNPRREGYVFTTRIRLRAGAGAVEATATAHGDAPCRGTITLSHARLGDFADEPLIIEAVLTSFQAGSDITDTHHVEITEADLR